MNHLECDELVVIFIHTRYKEKRGIALVDNLLISPFDEVAPERLGKTTSLVLNHERCDK